MYKQLYMYKIKDIYSLHFIAFYDHFRWIPVDQYLILRGPWTRLHVPMMSVTFIGTKELFTCGLMC